MNEDVHRNAHGYGLTRLVVIVRYNRVDRGFSTARRANGIQESFTCNLKRPVLDESVKGEREPLDPADLRFYRGSYLRATFERSFRLRRTMFEHVVKNERDLV